MIASSIRVLRELASLTVPPSGTDVKSCLEGSAHLADAVGDGLLFQLADHQSPFHFVEDVG
jgi:hypothetical protein